MDKKNSDKKVKLHYLYMNHYEGGKKNYIEKVANLLNNETMNHYNS